MEKVEPGVQTPGACVGEDRWHLVHALVRPGVQTPERIGVHVNFSQKRRIFRGIQEDSTPELFHWRDASLTEEVSAASFSISFKLHVSSLSLPNVCSLYSSRPNMYSLYLRFRNIYLLCVLVRCGSLFLCWSVSGETSNCAAWREKARDEEVLLLLTVALRSAYSWGIRRSSLPSLMDFSPWTCCRRKRRLCARERGRRLSSPHVSLLSTKKSSESTHKASSINWNGKWKGGGGRLLVANLFFSSWKRHSYMQQWEETVLLLSYAICSDTWKKYVVRVCSQVLEILFSAQVQQRNTFSSQPLVYRHRKTLRVPVYVHPRNRVWCAVYFPLTLCHQTLCWQCKSVSASHIKK